jgi:hypothetical protein
MEISRHWRLRKQRYSLTGFEDKLGWVSFESGPGSPKYNPSTGESREKPQLLPVRGLVTTVPASGSRPNS